MNVNETIREKKLICDTIELELARLKAQLARQKEGWVIEKKFVSLQDRISLESEIAIKQVEFMEIKKELRELKGAPGSQLRVELLWRTMKELLIERGLGDLIEEVQERVAAKVELV